MTLYNRSDSNRRKTWLLFFLFLGFIIFIGYLLSVYFDSPWLLYIAVIFSSLSAFFSYWFSDKFVLSMSNAKELKFEDNKEIYRLVENLCITIGLPTPKIYIINDPSPNAFATGRGPKKAVIALTTGLINKLDRSELEGVIAHELSHIKNYDILLMTLVTVLVGAVVIVADTLSRTCFQSSGSKSSNSSGSNSNSKGGAGLILIIVVLLISILAPFFAQLMQLAISRKREFLADADGALITRYPEGLARALEKISQDPNEVRAVNKATAHLYIASPFREKKKKGFFSKAFMTHPPVEDRVKALRGMDIIN